MLHPFFIISFLEVISRMRASTLCPCQRRLARLRSIGKKVAQFECLDKIGVPYHGPIGDAQVCGVFVLDIAEFRVAFGKRVMGTKDRGSGLHGALHVVS